MRGDFRAGSRSELEIDMTLELQEKFAESIPELLI
jgi:hypothetical protein